MPFEYYWYIESQVIGSRFTGELTESEMMQSASAIDEFIAACDPPVTLLIDTRDLKKLPLNFRSMLDSLEKSRGRGQVERVFMVSNSALLNFFSMMSSRFFKMPTYIFKTMEEAEQAIAASLVSQFE